MATKQELIDAIALVVTQVNTDIADDDNNTALDVRGSLLAVLDRVLANLQDTPIGSGFIETLTPSAEDNDTEINDSDPENLEIFVKGISLLGPIQVLANRVVELTDRFLVCDPVSLGNNLTITLPLTSTIPTDFFLFIYNNSISNANTVTVRDISGTDLNTINAGDNYLVYYKASSSNWEFIKINSPIVTDNTLTGDFTVDSPGGVNTSLFATADQGSKADSALQPGDNISDLSNDVDYATTSQIPTDNAQLSNGAGYITAGDIPPSGVQSVNGKTGPNVVLDPDDLDDTSTTNKFITSSDRTKLDNLSGTNTGDETTLRIQTKRPIKTVNGESLEGSGNVQVDTGVSSVTGFKVDNTDPANPIIEQPTPAEIGAATEAQGELADTAVQPADIVDFVDIGQVEAIAAGSTLGLEQALLAGDGQPGATTFAVGYTDTGRVQGCSLGEGNVVRVFADGDAYNSNTFLYQEFMDLGEPICFTDLSNGAIITATQGFYGFSECRNGSNESPMPLLSFGLSFKSSFFFMFRDSQQFDPGGTSTSQGWIHVVNGPLASTVSLKFGDGSIVQGQENIELAPWQYYRFYSSGNVEYILDSNNPIMACINARMGGTAPRYYDSRLVMPTANRIASWPRSGNVSGPFFGTRAPWYNRKGTSGELNSDGAVGPNPGVNPGFPVDWDAAPPLGTGASEQDYEPDGFTVQEFVGLGSAYSGADSAGLEASPAIPTAAMSQVVAQPLYISDNGDGGNSGIAIGSLYEGTAIVYSWDFNNKELVEEYVVPLTRGIPTPTTPAEQKIPASGLVANETVSGAVQLVGNLPAGVVIADVPITVVVQNGDVGFQQTIRSQNGTTVQSIISDDDETLSLGITPDARRAEIRVGIDGLLYKRVIGAGGTETWVVA